MNKDIIMDTTTTTAAAATTSSELQLCPASPDTQEIFRPTFDVSDVSAGNIQPITTIRPQHHQNNPRKKRTKMIRFHNSSKAAVRGVGVDSGSHSGVIAKKKPDPSAPKITRPCTECGKRFWSWKALFGHMRCHPERPWRGINPPPNLHHHHHPPPSLDHEDFTRVTTEEDEYVAGCLLMLAKGPTLPDTTTTTITASAAHPSTSYHHHHQPVLQDTLTDPESRFECSSCKKVFGSHQALGGHRASHKNVKGCFAITRNDGGTEELEEGEFVSHYDRTGSGGIGGSGGGGGDNMMVVLGSSHQQQQQQHRCTICLKIFSSGQALGGHKRCHWEKEDGLIPQSHLKFRFDLNLPASLQEDDDPTCSASNLDLRLSL